MFFFVFLLGLCFGSFANVLIYRLPRNKSIIYPPSSCPFCNKNIKWYDNIPILSFFILRGKCRNCSHQISIKYPIIEFLVGCIFVLVFFVVAHMIMVKFIFYSIFVFILFVISIIDFEEMMIPDSLSISLMILGILFSVFQHSILQSIIGGVFGFSFFYFLAYISEKIFKKEALGGGDIKLVAGIGFFLGINGCFYSIFIGSILTTIFGVFVILKEKKYRKESYYLPFGPFLSIGALVSLFFF